jgi:NTE family protein
MICGASIGALNGAVVACGPDLAAGSAQLLRVWREVADAVGAADFPDPGTPPPSPSGPDLPLLAQLDQAISGFSSPLIQDGYLEDLIARYVPVGDLQAGPPLWVSVYDASDLDLILPRWAWLLDTVRAPLTRAGGYERVTTMDPSQVHQAVMASAALPLVFPPRELGGRKVRDGGLFDNLPTGPLLAENCRYAIVVHLRQESLWNARTYKKVQILEIRPRRPLEKPGRLGWINGLLDFSPGRIEALIEQGYADAERTLAPLRAALAAHSDLHTSADAARTALAQLEQEFPLDG